VAFDRYLAELISLANGGRVAGVVVFTREVGAADCVVETRGLRSSRTLPVSLVR
jgi:hypothetical protein